jgi:hypothetical protein
VQPPAAVVPLPTPALMGREVYHPDLGRGRVTAVEGTDDRWVIVEFDSGMILTFNREFSKFLES